MSCELLLEGNFLLYPSRAEVNLRLRGLSLEYSIVETRSEIEVPFRTIIGCNCFRTSKDIGTLSKCSPSIFSVFAYVPIRRKKEVTRHRRIHSFIVNRNSDNYLSNFREAEQWRNAILFLARFPERYKDFSVMSPPDRLILVCINPFAGNGSACNIFRNQIYHLFEEAGVHFKIFLTESKDHLKRVVQRLELSHFYAIVILSGDGLFHEAINGLMLRRDWANAIKMPLGIIPAGSGNALATALNLLSGDSTTVQSITHAALSVVKPTILPLDLWAVDTCHQRLYAAVCVSWGMVADVDILSERFRFLGELRFGVEAINRILRLKSYEGVVSFLPVKPCLKPSINPNCLTHAKSLPSLIPRSTTRHLGLFSSRHLTTVDEHVPSDAVPLSPIDIVNSYCSADLPNDSPPTPFLSSLREPVPDDWVVLSDRFVSVCAVNTAYLTNNMYWSPSSEINDGAIALTLIREGITRSQMFEIFRHVESGAHLNQPLFEVIPVKAFRIEPISTDGIIAVDGEKVEYGPIQAQILPSFGNILARPQSLSTCV